MKTDYKQKQEIINQLSKWWVQNGWNPKTLEQKSLSQLLGIRSRAQRSNWAVQTKGVAKGQLSIQFTY